MLDFTRTWLPFIYLYAAGGIIFSTGMYIITRSESLKIQEVTHKTWYYLLIFGFFYYAGIHAFFIFLALNK